MKYVCYTIPVILVYIVLYSRGEGDTSGGGEDDGIRMEGHGWATLSIMASQ